LKNRILTVVNIFLFLLVIFSIYDNILILDDFHPSYNSLVFSSDENQDVTESIKGYSIYINLDSLLLKLYKDGSLIGTYPVSGGKAETPSPTGTWKIISKSSWGEGFGGSWMGLNVPWGNYGIHGTKSPWYVGKSNASHGCIRMKNKDAKELFGIVPHGTPVTIVQKNKPFRTLKSGDIGSDVLTVQKVLKELGYFHDWTSGKFGDNLKRSVIRYQKANNFKVTGTVSKALYDNIIKKYEDKLKEEENSNDFVH